MLKGDYTINKMHSVGFPTKKIRHLSNNKKVVRSKFKINFQNQLKSFNTIL